MPPPDKVKPPDEERLAAERPPLKEDEAVEVFVIEPPETARPFEEASPAEVIPPTKDDVAAPVTDNPTVWTVPVETTPATVVVPAKKAFPWTPKSVAGLVEPMPTESVKVVV